MLKIVIKLHKIQTNSVFYETLNYTSSFLNFYYTRNQSLLKCRFPTVVILFFYLFLKKFILKNGDDTMKNSDISRQSFFISAQVTSQFGWPTNSIKKRAIV